MFTISESMTQRMRERERLNVNCSLEGWKRVFHVRQNNFIIKGICMPLLSLVFVVIIVIIYRFHHREHYHRPCSHLMSVTQSTFCASCVLLHRHMYNEHSIPKKWINRRLISRLNFYCTPVIYVTRSKAVHFFRLLRPTFIIWIKSKTMFPHTRIILN